MRILVLNSGSSSIKYLLFDMESGSVEASGLLERIGGLEGRLTHHTFPGETTGRTSQENVPVADHRQGLDLMAATLQQSGVLGSLAELDGMGHRVAHGGEAFRNPTLIDDAVLAAIRKLTPLAPLHNPANLLGIEIARARCPGVPQVAVFDTAFHQTLPPQAYLYALPYALYESHHLRRYGFHGTSHHFVAKRAAVLLNRPLETLRLIVLHLGNGASATAIAQGRSIDTSMGLTPLEGLVMGTRCGDLDPAMVFALHEAAGLSYGEVETLLNRQSGLEGLCGAHDMREVLRRAEGGDPRARLAVSVYTYRIKKYIGAYWAALGGLDALVFTAGVGENAAEIRAGCCEGLAGLGLKLDDRRNREPARGPRAIQAAESAVSVLVIPTNEELEIAEQTVTCIRNAAATP